MVEHEVECEYGNSALSPEQYFAVATGRLESLLQGTVEVSRALEDKDIPGVSIFHPQRILNYAVERGVDDQFLVYPATFFDPAWRFVPTPQGYEEISKVTTSHPIYLGAPAFRPESLYIYYSSRRMYT
eukprot:scaffold1653_cov389-Prasinococcus_capsulatus_cf.AAC.6